MELFFKREDDGACDRMTTTGPRPLWFFTVFFIAESLNGKGTGEPTEVMIL
ncbi:hypothetical protein J2T13_005058 [Paenibacillus sp. DS2015]